MLFDSPHNDESACHAKRVAGDWKDSMRPLFPLLVCFVSLSASIALARDHGPKRTKAIDLVVLHAIGGPECRDGNVFFPPIKNDAAFWAGYIGKHNVIGIHYVIDRRGSTVAVIAEGEVANHVKGHNETSIGIELVNNGDGIDPFPEAQVSALVKLAKEIRLRYGLSDGQVKSHQELDRGPPLECGIARRVDPGPALDLTRVIAESRP